MTLVKPSSTNPRARAWDRALPLHPCASLTTPHLPMNWRARYWRWSRYIPLWFWKHILCGQGLTVDLALWRRIVAAAAWYVTSWFQMSIIVFTSDRLAERKYNLQLTLPNRVFPVLWKYFQHVDYQEELFLCWPLTHNPVWFKYCNWFLFTPYEHVHFPEIFLRIKTVEHNIYLVPG